MRSKPHISVGIIGGAVFLHTNTIAITERVIESLPCEKYQSPGDVLTIARDYELTMDAKAEAANVFIKKEGYKDRAERNQPWYAKFRKGKRK